MGRPETILKWLAGGAALVSILGYFRRTQAQEAEQTTVLVGATPPSDQPRAPEGYERYRGAVDTYISDVAKRSLKEPFGSFHPFKHPDGRHLGVLLEWHYHPPGGPLRPWGWHKGASIFERVGTPA